MLSIEILRRFSLLRWVTIVIMISACKSGNEGAGAGGIPHIDDTREYCPALPEPSGNIIHIEPSLTGQLQGIIASASSGDTILLADGIYSLNGAYLWFSSPGVTLRSESGNRDQVIIDGGYQTTEIITIVASNITIADVTLRRAYTHPIHVFSSVSGDTRNTLIYNVRITDPREQAIKINPDSPADYFPDDGTIACCYIELTDDGRPYVNPASGGCYTGGIDAHQARGWVIRDNRIEGFWCNSGLSEHGVHLWRGSRDTIVLRNVFVNNARAVGFGMDNSGTPRTYDDNACPSAGSEYVGHYDGVISSNFVFAGRAELFASGNGFDCGICLWSACGAQVLHNTIVSTDSNFSAIEWRYAATAATITNNIATHPLREREGATASLAGNLEAASLLLFVDGSGGDLHLASDAVQAINQGEPVVSDYCEYDIDGEHRDRQPDIGADEFTTP